MKVFLYVQHLLGIGHLKRAAVLAAALERAGMKVCVASGGLPVAGFFAPGVRVVQLPPASAQDASFALVDEHGRPVDDAWRERRRNALLHAFRESEADALVVELFPFGRRQMRFELIPLLEAARASAKLIACSVRDLIQPKPEREPEIVELVARFFDLVLVHGDPALASFERTFAAAPRLGPKLRYTGYVVEPPRNANSGAGRGEVIVSAGGGAVGGRLLEAAIAGRAWSALAQRTWRVLAGAHGRPPAAAAGVVVEQSRDDFPVLLANCEVSVSQAGYNTVMETLQARARAVLVPFAAEREAEQSLRARLLCDRGLLEVVEEAALSPPTLAAAIDRAHSRPRPEAAIDLRGGPRSAELLLEHAR